MGCACVAKASSLALGTTDAYEQPPCSSSKEKGCKNTDKEQLDLAHRRLGPLTNINCWAARWQHFNDLGAWPTETLYQPSRLTVTASEPGNFLQLISD